MGDICVSRKTMTKLMPLHILLTDQGTIVQYGPTLDKIFDTKDLIGQSFFDLFSVLRPYGVASVADIINSKGAKLHLQTRNGKNTTMKGVGMSVVGGGDLLLDLSFGISVVDAIGNYKLTIGDFAHTDLAVEMLYLLEAKSAAMSESRKLNTRLQGAKIAAEEQAFTDTLTGLKNRRAMDYILDRLMDAGETFSLMQIDLDFFKAVNDTMGHAAGDFVLQNVAKIMRDEIRGEDLVARVGGDEFVAIFHNLDDEAELNDVAARLISRLEVPMSFNGQECKISASIGITISNRYPFPDKDQMLSDADIALYASKHKGRACSTVYSDDLARGPELQESIKGRDGASAA